MNSEPTAMRVLHIIFRFSFLTDCSKPGQNFEESDISWLLARARRLRHQRSISTGEIRKLGVRFYSVGYTFYYC